MPSNNNAANQPTRHAITLDELSTLIAAEISAFNDDQDPQQRRKVFEAICVHVSQACRDDGFIEKNLPERAAGEPDREVLYEDPELGFCICGHVYAGPALGSPHDHGPSWAIYGQAEGETEMSDWEIASTEPAEGSGNNAEPVKLVRKTSTYTLQRGDVHVYDTGDVHSPKREKPVKLIRVEGENLDNIKRSAIKRLE